jgi:hypothetical protein
MSFAIAAFLLAVWALSWPLTSLAQRFFGLDETTEDL